ncbi:hypothetical protein Tco_1261109, partial [Tanacetum coccineum]
LCLAALTGTCPNFVATAVGTKFLLGCGIFVSSGSGNISKTQSMTMFNDPLSQEIGSTDRPMYQEAMWGVITQTRSKRASIYSYDSPLPGEVTHLEVMGRPDLHELMAKSSIPPPKRRLYKQVDSFDDSLGEENASKQGRNDSNKTKEFNLSDKGSGGTKVFDDTIAAKKDVNAAEPVSTAGDAVTAASVIPNIDTDGPSNVSAVGPSTSTARDIFEDEMMTIADTLVAIRSTRPRTTLVVIHDVKEEPRRATPVLIVQSQDKEDQAQFKREQMIARERAAKQEAKDAALIAKFDKVQARTEVDALYTHSQLKYKSVEEIQKLYEREQKWINDFVLMDSEEGEKKAESSKKEVASSKKRQKANPDDENVKRQKLEDVADKEGLKAYLKIVPDEDRAVNYETLATKYPIVDWESQIIGSDLQGNDLSYWKITRAYGSSKFYKVFSMMLEDFDRQDLVDLHRLVKERSASRALEGYDLILWGDLKTMFEPSEEDDVWTNQHDWSLISWKLYETCRVHTLLVDADFENEMAYELIRGGLLGIKASQVSIAGYKSFYCWLKKLLLVKIRENSLSH